MCSSRAVGSTQNERATIAGSSSFLQSTYNRVSEDRFELFSLPPCRGWCRAVPGFGVARVPGSRQWLAALQQCARIAVAASARPVGRAVVGGRASIGSPRQGTAADWLHPANMANFYPRRMNEEPPPTAPEKGIHATRESKSQTKLACGSCAPCV